MKSDSSNDNTDVIPLLPLVLLLPSLIFSAVVAAASAAAAAAAVDDVDDDDDTILSVLNSVHRHRGGRHTDGPGRLHAGGTRQLHSRGQLRHEAAERVHGGSGQYAVQRADLRLPAQRRVLVQLLHGQAGDDLCPTDLAVHLRLLQPGRGVEGASLRQ